MKKLFMTIALMAVAMILYGQEAPAPKWLSKAQKSIVSVITYDKNREKLHEGCGFVVSTDGAVISTYNTFKEAYSGVVVDASGNKYDVERILGADDLYGLVRFRISNKKTTPVTFASATASNRGMDVLAIGYTKGKVNVVPKAAIEKKDMVGDGKYAYYTITTEFDGKQEGHGLFNTKGELLGIILSSVDKKSGAIDGAMGRDLTLEALQNRSQSMAFNKIYIKKGIPETPEEALVYLYLKSRSADNDEYMDLVNLFIETFPENAEGYLRRATPLIDLHRFDDAERDLQTYLRLVADKGQGHASVAKTIYTKLLYMPEPAYDKWTYPIALDHVEQALTLMKEDVDKEPKAELKEMKKATLYETILLKAQMLSSSGDHRGSLAIYDEMNAGEYKGPGTYYAASMEHQLAGDTIDVQIEMMDSCLAQFPDSLPPDAATFVMRRAKLYTTAGQYRKAVADYNTFYELNKGQVSSAFYYDRSQLELQGRMYQQALDDITKAVEQTPESPLYLVEKSAMHLRVNQLDECISAAEKCIALSQEYPDAYRILGYAQIQKGDKVSARRNLEKAKELGDESAQEIMDKFLK